MDVWTHQYEPAGMGQAWTHDHEYEPAGIGQAWTAWAKHGRQWPSMGSAEL